MKQLHFNFYSTREEFVAAFVEQFIKMAPNFKIKGGLR